MYNIVTVTNAKPKKNSGQAERLIFHSQFGPLLWTAGEAKQCGRRVKKDKDIHLTVAEGKRGGTKREGKGEQEAGEKKSWRREKETETERGREKEFGGGGERKHWDKNPSIACPQSTFFSRTQLLKLSAVIYNSTPSRNQAVNI